MAPASARAPGTPAAERELRSQGRKTMAKLLDAGMKVLAERGYQAARVDDVVRVARLSHGTFYLYFTNKEDLFRALATECADEMKALAGTLGPIDQSDAGLQELRRWLREFLGIYRRYGAVIRAWMEDQVIDRELVRLGLDAFAVITAALHDQVAAASPAHLPDVSLATPAMLAMIERFCYFTGSRELGISDDVASDTLATMIHRGFFGAAVNGGSRAR